MLEAVASPYLVPFDGSFRVADATTAPPAGASDKNTLEERLDRTNDVLEDLQRVLYADNRWALLIIFQALDAAGKDSTIRAVFDGVDPAGCQVFSFKQPSAEELDHDFLWRTSVRLPERGRIGIFNRSYYEEVLVVRVHPEYLYAQRLPEPARRAADGAAVSDDLWRDRYTSIRDHEAHLARNGTAIVKFWLNVSRDEQRRRFLSRLNEPHKNWKFVPGDVREREHWDAYMRAYQDALAATSRPWAPWYAIPADSKSYMRMVVAEIIVATLRSLDLAYPTPEADVRARFDEMRRLLENDSPDR